MNIHNIRARTVAVVVGVGLLGLVAGLPGRWFGDNLLFLFLFHFTVYGIAGLVLGFIWPASGWRLGLYLSAVWVPVLALGAFLSWEQSTTTWATLLDLLGYFLMVVGACAGAAGGAMIARSRLVEAEQVSNSQ